MEKQKQPLKEIRENIAGIDRELIRLITKRSQYVHEEAKLSGEIITVSEDKIISTIKDWALMEGLNTEVAEKIFRTMISAFVKKETEEADPLYKQMMQSYY
jgi:Chorismate mutase